MLSKSKFIILKSSKSNVKYIFDLIFSLNKRHHQYFHIPIFLIGIPKQFYEYKIQDLVIVVETYYNHKSNHHLKTVDISSYVLNRKVFFIYDNECDSENNLLISHVCIYTNLKQLVTFFYNINLLIDGIYYLEILCLIDKYIYRPFIIDCNESQNIQEINERLLSYHKFLLTSFIIFCEIYKVKYNSNFNKNLNDLQCGFIENCFKFISSYGKYNFFKFNKFCANISFANATIIEKRRMYKLIREFSESIKLRKDEDLNYITDTIKGYLNNSKIFNFIKSLEPTCCLTDKIINSMISIKYSYSKDSKALASSLISLFTNYIYLSKFHLTDIYRFRYYKNISEFIDKICTKNELSRFVNLFHNILFRLDTISKQDKEEIIKNKSVSFENNFEFIKLLNKCKEYQFEIVNNTNLLRYGLFIEMGLGKTFLTLIDMFKYFKLIDFYFVILPPHLIKYWLSEIEKHETQLLLDKIIFLKYSSMSNNSIADIIEIYEKYKIYNVMFIMDESTYVKNSKSIRSENVCFLILMFSIRTKLITILRVLTGTPYSNNVVQMRGQMNLLNPFITPSIKIFNAICDKLSTFKKKSEYSSFSETITTVSDKYEKSNNKTIFSKVYEILYLLKYFINNYFIIINRKSIGIDIPIINKVIQIEHPKHLECLSNLIELYNDNMIKKIEKNKELNLDSWLNKNKNDLHFGYFLPLYYFSAGGLTDSIINLINDYNLDISIYEKCLNDRIRKLINNIYKTFNHNRFVFISSSKDALNKTEKILNKMGISNKIITGDTKIQERQSIIDNYNNKSFDVLISSANCLAYGFSIYGVNTMVFNEPPMQIEVYKQLKCRMIRLDSKEKFINIYIACTGHIHNKANDALSKNTNLMDVFNEMLKSIVSKYFK